MLCYAMILYVLYLEYHRKKKNPTEKRAPKVPFSGDVVLQGGGSGDGHLFNGILEVQSLKGLSLNSFVRIEQLLVCAGISDDHLGDR